MNKNQLTLFLLVAIILLGGSLRLYNLDSEGLWLDESYALKEADQPRLSQTLQAVAGPPEGVPPLYFIILHYQIRLFGNSEFSLRLPSVIFAIISIYLVFLVGKELFDKKTGLISSLIMAVSMIQILYSQEARPYSLLTMLALLSILFYIKLLKTNKNLLFYILSTILMLYTHYVGFFVLFSQNVIYFLFYNKFTIKLKKWLIYVAALILLYIPGIFIIASQFKHSQQSLQSSLSIKLGLPSFISQLGVFNFLWPILAISIFVIIIFYLNIDLSNLLRKLKFNENIFFLLILIIFAACILFIPKLTSSLFITRYSHFAYPFFYILLAKGFTSIKKIKIKRIITILFVIIAIFSLFNYYFKTPRKEQWREAISFIESNSKEGEIIILIDDDIQTIFDYYYKGNLEITGINAYMESNKNQIELDKLKLVIKNKKGYWLVLSHAYRTKGLYKKYFDKNYNFVQETHLIGIDIYHYI